MLLARCKHENGGDTVSSVTRQWSIISESLIVLLKGIVVIWAKRKLYMKMMGTFVEKKGSTSAPSRDGALTGRRRQMGVDICQTWPWTPKKHNTRK
jgi:hypothetical protein